VSAAGTVFLVGFMGCGKSRIGRRLADELDREFIDTDALVERREGRLIESIFRDDGEGRFREAEWQALRSLAGRPDAVVATGGGLFLGVPQRRFIREQGTSVWLDVSLDVARRRVGEGAGRPLWLQHDPLALRAMFEKRRVAYALADVRVDATASDADALALAIARRLSPIFR
jgi:shikimate kinase